MNWTKIRGSTYIGLLITAVASLLAASGYAELKDGVLIIAPIDLSNWLNPVAGTVASAVAAPLLAGLAVVFGWGKKDPAP
jgi:hypothetical protein